MYVFCGPRESFCQSTKESVEIDNEDERIAEVLVRSVVSLCGRVKTRVRVDYELSEEFVVIVGMH